MHVAFNVLMMKVVSASETSADFCETTWRSIPEGSHPHSLFSFHVNVSLNLCQIPVNNIGPFNTAHGTSRHATPRHFTPRHITSRQATRDTLGSTREPLLVVPLLT
jgi:hypothetical protein